MSESSAMKTVKKFTSFKDLKSAESITEDHKSNLKRHIDFERVLKNIYAKVHPNNRKSN